MMASKSVKWLVCLGLGLSCSVGARRASAWEATQITLQTTAVSYLKATVSANGSDDVSGSVTSYGLFGSGVGAGFGYAWDNVVLGGRINLQSASSGGDSATTLSLLPRLEYQTSPGDTGVFVAGTVGLSYATRGDVSLTQYVFGGSLGMHGFVDPAVSLDPEITVVGLTGSQSASGSDQSVSETGVQVLLTLGLSGWITSKRASPFPPPAPETVEAPSTAAAPTEEDEADKPLYASLHLPGHRQLYLQASKDPARTSLIVRLSEPHSEAALAACDDISVFTSTGPLRMRVRSHGDHFVAGRLPLNAAELLASSSDATISVCAVQWTLGQESREAIQTFLNDRRDLLDKTGDSDAPADAEPAPAAPPIAAPIPPAPAPPATSPPTGTFAPTPAPAQTAPLKKK